VVGIVAAVVILVIINSIHGYQGHSPFPFELGGELFGLGNESGVRLFTERGTGYHIGFVLILVR
jgi:hypothetical protein